MPEDQAGRHQLARNIALIADDDEFFRMALQALLKMKLGFREVIEASSMDEAVDSLTRHQGDIDLALFDLNMPGMNNWVALRSVREEFADTVVAVVSGSNRAEDVLMALSAGVHGYVYKGAGICELNHALEAICGGSVYVPPLLPDMALSVAHDVIEKRRSDSPEGGLDEADAEILRHVTPRQGEILEMLVAGKSNKEMARTLELSEGAVKFHVSALLRRLGVSNRTEAAAAGVRLLRAKA